jgi:hypothetical protein
MLVEYNDTFTPDVFVSFFHLFCFSRQRTNVWVGELHVDSEM